ncbi:alpha/beta hydrolase [Arthrobacter monumenti]
MEAGQSMESPSWEPDFLGHGFEKLDLPLGTDEEGEVLATLVRYRPTAAVEPAGEDMPLLQQLRTWWNGNGDNPTGPARPAPQAVLYVHGWNDYFFHVELAQFWASLGVACYAVDLRKFGRSLRPHQTPGYMTSLEDYDADLEAAIKAVETDQRTLHGQANIEGGSAEVNVNLMAHSAGGLIAALWVHRHPGRIRSLILNSPWLELYGSSIVRNATASLVEPLARVRPKARLKLPEFGLYWRSLSNQADGEWELNSDWRWEYGFPIRAGWLRAVLAGHSQIAAGLKIDAPVLVLISARSVVSPTWTDDAMQTDIVLDVEQIALRAPGLGRRVTIVRTEGALHDVLLSSKSVRHQVYQDLEQWARCYLLEA